MALERPDLGMFDNIKKEMEASNFLQRLKNEEARISAPLTQEKSFYVNNKLSRFVVLRRWNSFSPLMAVGDEHSLGGGYVLVWQGKVIVIDPGSQFIANFHSLGFRVADIHAIVITHSHVDHFHDFESLLSLIFELNDRETKKRPKRKNHKRVHILVSPGAFKKWSGWLDLHHHKTVRRKRNIPIAGIYLLDPNLYGGMATMIPETKDLIRIKAIPAVHDEIFAHKYSTGLIFELYSDPAGDPDISLGITSDTESNDTNRGILTEAYRECRVLVMHLGGIAEQEFQEKGYYENHLGLKGCCTLLDAPGMGYGLAILSEFGEELKDYRRELADILRQHLPAGKCLVCGDVGTVVDLKRDVKLLCEFPDCEKEACYFDVFEDDGAARHYCTEHLPAAYFLWKKRFRKRCPKGFDLEL
jgi:hypothetical protein